MSINSDAADILESAAFVIGTGHHAKGTFGMAMAGVLLARWDRLTSNCAAMTMLTRSHLTRFNE